MAGVRPEILVVEDDPGLADQIRWGLKDTYRIRMAHDRPRALADIRKYRPEVVLLDLCLPPDNVPEEGFTILRAARQPEIDATAIVMSATDQRRDALRAVAEGAYDFFPKPLDLTSLRVVIGRAFERRALERENRSLREQIDERFGIDGIVGTSASMRPVFEAIRRVKDSPVTVLLTGESGTGKGLVARALHYNGVRRERPFVPVHCAAFPETLLEAELFGHEKGAFTGADVMRIGRFEAADTGTLFLDEVGCLSPSIQMKLLRVLEERSVERLGSNRIRPVDIRLVAATNDDLEAKVASGSFREDLFYRLNVFPVRVPPLRERGEDILLLADHFLRSAGRGGDGPRRFSPEARRALLERAWPGNVRELQNVVEAVALVCDSQMIGLRDLPRPRITPNDGLGIEQALSLGFKDAVEKFERTLLTEAIERCGGVRNRAARTLGLAPGQMKYFVKKHGL